MDIDTPPSKTPLLPLPADDAMDLDHPTPPSATPTSSASPLVRPPPPPVALITSSDVSAWPKFKLDQLFVEWLSRPDSTRWLSQLLDHHRAPRTPDRERVREKPAPGSPVSRLFSNHIPFGDETAWDHPDDPRHMSALDLRTPAQASDDALHSAPVQKESVHSAPGRAAAAASASAPAAGVVAQPQPQHAVQPMQTAPDAATVSAPMQSLTSSVETKVLEESKPEAQAVSTNALPPVPPSPLSEDSALMTDAPLKRPAARQKRRVLAQFYFPCGRDRTMREKKEMAFIQQFFRIQREQKHLPGVTRTDIAELVVEVIGLPSYFAGIVFNAIVQLYGNANTERAKADIEVRSCTNTAMQNDGNANSQNASQQLQQDQPQPQQDATMGDIESPQRPNGFMSSPLNDSSSNTINNNNTINNINTNNSINNPNNQSNHSAGAAVDNPSNNKASTATITSTTSTSINSTSTTATKSSNVDMPNDNGMSNDDSSASGINNVNNNNNSSFSSFSSAAGAAGASNNPSSSSTNALAANSHLNSSPEQQLQQSQQQQQRHQVVADPTTVLQSTGGVTPNVSALVPGEFITEEQFSQYYRDKCFGCSREQRLFNALLQPNANRNYLIPSDFKPLLRALLMCHQGLAFLHSTPEFQQRYSETVIERIYFGCTKQHNGRLTLQDIKRSKLLVTLMVVDEEEDINRERKYFSYEHFYVLYCRFWELDANHDLQIDREDLMRYGSHSLTYRIVDRIFGGYARPLDTPENPGFMSYTDFIWFCLSEEDKTSDTAIDYWFRCIDMDGDGLITMYDMEFFYSEQLHRMECFGHEPVQIRDILCQLLDMIKPNVKPPVIRRNDLKKCRLAGNFFNVLFNLNKFFAIEARDPLQIRQEHATPELTDWDRFAALEYLRLSAEEEGEEEESWEEVADTANPLMAGEAPF